MSPRRVAIVGAGAAGTMAAIFAAAAGAEVVLFERTRDGGRKVLISGGGRCNVLPARLDESRFVTDSSPNTLRKILRSWPLAAQIRFFEEELGLPLEEEQESGKLFPASNRARDVRDGLLAQARRQGARFVPNTAVTGLRPSAGGWVVESGHDLGRFDAVVLATGGLSVPATGSDGTGLTLLGQMGHLVHPTYPALTPVTCTPPVFADLSGISLQVGRLAAKDTVRQATAAGGFLFTHRGYSGPAVLDVSHVLVRARLEGRPEARLTVQWTADGPAAWDQRLRGASRRNVATVVREALPERLADRLLDLAGVTPAVVLSQLRREERQRLVDALTRFDLPWTGDEGYRKAEVTGGGVSLAEVDPRTLESRRHAGLFLCGEVLDAFGPIGGYNFAWAWSTGRAAGLGAAANHSPTG